MGDSNLLDALADAFVESDEDGDYEESRKSSILMTAEKSAFYRSALDDQIWLHNGDGENSRNSGAFDVSDATPTGQPPEKKQLSFSTFEQEMHESYAKLPSVGDSSSESQLSSGELDQEMDALKKRLQELEEEKKRRWQKPSEAIPRVDSGKESLRKVQECPIDFSQPRSRLGIDAEGGESVVEKANSDDEENLEATSGRLSRKRKSEVERSGNPKIRRSALASADSPATTALREKGKDVTPKLDRKDHRFCSSAAYDQFFGIRVQTPKISSVTFQNYVGIRQKVRIGDLTTDYAVNWNDWVTMGVLVDKTPLKTSASGSQFSIWKLSDLIDCQRVVRVLLFGDSAKALWKLNKGDVVALLNAVKMDNKPDGFPAEKTSVVTLKIDNKQKIVELGICPDYGICKGTRKQDNLHCTNFVNKSKSDYCDFHLLTASKRLAAKRGEFQLGSNVPPKKFNNPVKKVLAGGNLRTSRLPIKSGLALPLNLSRKSIGMARPSKTKPSSGQSKKPTVLNQERSTREATAGMSTEPNGSHLRCNTIGNGGPSQLAKNEKSDEPAKNNYSRSALARPKLTCKQFLAASKVNNGQGQTLRLAKGEEAMAKAISILRARSAVPKSDAVSTKSKSSSSSAQGVNSGNVSASSKGSRLLGQISNLTKEQLKELAGTKSLHEAELHQEDAQRQEEYFKIMEAKEKVDQRATEVMSLKGCKVVTCRTCKYTWHAQSALCKQNAHVVHWHTAEKRFFKCRTCGTKTVSYDKYPNKPCQCGSTTFIRVAMRQESKGPQMIGETLKIRGDEVPFVNS